MWSFTWEFLKRGDERGISMLQGPLLCDPRASSKKPVLLSPKHIFRTVNGSLRSFSSQFLHNSSWFWAISRTVNWRKRSQNLGPKPRFSDPEMTLNPLPQRLSPIRPLISLTLVYVLIYVFKQNLEIPDKRVYDSLVSCLFEIDIVYIRLA